MLARLQQQVRHLAAVREADNPVDTVELLDLLEASPKQLRAPAPVPAHRLNKGLVVPVALLGQAPLDDIERVRDEVGVLRGLDDDGPPLPTYAGADAEKAAEAAAGQVGEDVAEDERDQIKRQLLDVKERIE